MADAQAAIPNDFFVAGGTLRATAPSYVLRPADTELFTMTAQGAFCYVLTPRQMGKSSLMIRTSRRLNEQGIRTGIVDLTQIGAKVSIEQWYLGLLAQLRRSLKLTTDYAEWWSAHSALGEVQRFSDFLREVVLTEIAGSVVIFIDEIDSTLQLDFRDDFFAAIRAMYNARAESPDFQRLSFVLLGVASPPDLIKDLTRTPFNIGQAIALKEFSRADAAVLQAELEKQFPGKGGDIFDRVYYWTNGHPYLTQKLCLTIAERAQIDWNTDVVDALVRQQFLTEEARKESNLQYVQNNILSHPLKLPMLKLYRQVVRGSAVMEDQSPVQNQLKLSGLVKADRGTLQVHNRVYAQVFHADWVRANIPVNWTKVLAVAASVSLIAMIGFFGYFFVIQPEMLRARITAAENAFYKGTPKERITALATIVRSNGTFDVKDNADLAVNLFNSLRWDDQLRLFDPYEISDNDDQELVDAIKALYVTLADIDETGSNLKLLQKMRASLDKHTQNEQAKNLRDEIKAWLDGVAAESSGDIAAATGFYGVALNLNPSNPALRFTRGQFYVKTNRPAEALSEFNEVVLIAQQLATTANTGALTTTAVPTPTASASALITETVNVATKASLGKASDGPLTSPLVSPLTTPDNAPPGNTPTPVPTPAVERFAARFDKTSNMIGAVQEVVARELGLRAALAAAPATATLALRGVLSAQSLQALPAKTRLWVGPNVAMDMVLVRAGPFLMGSDKSKDSQAFNEELPQHSLTLGDYYIGKYEVTNAQFAAFVQATGYTTTAEKEGSGYAWTGSKWEDVKGADWRHPRGPDSNIDGKAQHPVVQISWHDAIAFCDWLSQVSGRKVMLPSEVEWEKAARGPSTGSGDGRIYPWGNDAPTNDLLNFNGNVGDTTPVGQYSPRGDSPYGAADMAGNAWEWTRSLWGKGDTPEFKYPYVASDGREDLKAGDDVRRVVRGSSWYYPVRFVRAAFRGGSVPSNRSGLQGLRVMISAPV